MQAWEPRSETVPLHAWLHPWLPLLGAQLEDLYPGIRFRLAAALQQWHPSDASALALLSPWHTARPRRRPRGRAGPPCGRGAACAGAAAPQQPQL